MDPSKQPPGAEATATTPAAVNLNPRADDCYFFFYSTCTKGDKCKFRHCSAAMGTDVICDLWYAGRCTREICVFKHSNSQRQRSAIPCYWENQPSGCLKSHCPFKHSKPRPQPSGPMDRLNQFKDSVDTVKFTSMKVKTLEEIRQEKQSHPQQQQTSQQQQQQQQQQQKQQHGQPSQQGQEESIRSPTSFQLKAVLQESGVRVSSSSTCSSKPTTSVPNTQQTAANSGSSIQVRPVATISALQTGIFAGNQDSTSIFSPKYTALSSSEGAKTTGEGVMSNSQRQSKFSVQVGTGRNSDKSTPCGSPTKTTPAEDILSAKAPVVKSVSVVQISKRPQVSINSKEGETKLKLAPLTALQSKVAPLPAPQGASGSTAGKSMKQPSQDFVVKTLEEIRAERKRKAKQDKKPSSDDSLKVLPLRKESNDGIQPASVTADVKPKKKIILVRKKPLKTSEKSSVKPTGDQKLAGAISAEEEEKAKEMLAVQNGKLEQIAVEDKRPDLEGRGAVKRRKLLQTSNDVAVASRSIAALPASTQKDEGPPDVDMVCIERSVPLEKGRMAAVTEQVEEPGTNEDSQDTTNKGKLDSGNILQRLSSGVEQEESLLSPLEEEGRVVSGEKRQSIAEMKAEIQLELCRRKSEHELPEDTLEAELQRLEEELMEGGEDDSELLDSRTDDDLMLDIEEFI